MLAAALGIAFVAALAIYVVGMFLEPDEWQHPDYDQHSGSDW